ncbi:mechanosensitive ion channel family protein [Patescibacteria group bacterium]|nr:mechanosensitive ion channel family protein [Patescibacteria group bacterium]
MIERLQQELAISWMAYADHLAAMFPKYLAGILIFLVFWIISRIERQTTRTILERIKDPLKKESTILVARITRVILVGIGIIAALSIFGINWTALATGIGLVGFGFSFALKDYIENFLGGVIILTQKPFSIGDQVKVGDNHGIVEVIATRYTIIKRFDGEQVIVPNSDILSKSINKVNAYGRKRYKISFDLDLSTDVGFVLKKGLNIVEKTVGVLTRPKPRVVIDEIGQGMITLNYYFWANPKEEVELQSRSMVYQNLLKFFESEDISLGVQTSKVIAQRALRNSDRKTKKQEEDEDGPTTFEDMPEEF